MHPTPRTSPRWWLLGPATAVLLTVVVILATRYGAITASQPAYLITLLVFATASIIAVASSLIDLGWHRSHERDRSRARVIASRALGMAATTALVLALAWLRPLPATEVAVASMSGNTAVHVVDSTSLIELDPTAHQSTTGLIFFPGALVDPRAYVPLLNSIAAHGFPVVVVKPPYGIAFLAAGAPSGIITDHPSVTRWVIGGHSLGGVVASSYAGGGHPRVDGLLLWASYPNGSIASATSLLVTSVAAGNDGLATPAKIEASKPDLPPTTRFVTVEGAVHADFGDYGTQRGDGTPAISHAAAQRQIEAASLALMEQVATRARS